MSATLGFPEVFLQNNNHPADNKMKRIENRKIQLKTVRIVLESFRVLVSVCPCVCVYVCLCGLYLPIIVCVCVSGI